jgi:hypothetical protein
MSAGAGGLRGPAMIGVVLIAAGVLALTYGGFTYTKNTQQAKIGPLELSIKDTRTVNIPLWLGVGAIAAGGLMLVIRR